MHERQIRRESEKFKIQWNMSEKKKKNGLEDENGHECLSVGQSREYR